jgi:predicted O-methyltransferase YrrM
MPLGAEHFEYLTARTSGDDRFLVELKNAARAAGIPAIWISPEQASLMQILLKSSGARRVVEVGTLAGYSAIAMARALPPAAPGGNGGGGKLVTTARASTASRANGSTDGRRRPGGGLQGRGTRCSPAGLLRRRLRGRRCRAIRSTRESLRLVRPGGLIMVDNAFAFGEILDEGSTDPDVRTLRAFNDQLARTSGLHGIIVPIGDGLWVAVRDPGPR